MNHKQTETDFLALSAVHISTVCIRMTEKQTNTVNLICAFLAFKSFVKILFGFLLALVSQVMIIVVFVCRFTFLSIDTSSFVIQCVNYCY